MSGQPARKKLKRGVDIKDNEIFALQNQLVNNEKFSDIILVVGGKRYPAHRLLLANASDVFELMLTNRNWVDSGKSELILQEDDDCCEVFEHFLRYLYTGDIVDLLSIDNVLSVYVLADKYDVSGLKDSCTEYMKSILGDLIDPCHAVIWYQFAQTYSNGSLQRACLDFIVWNADMFMKSAQWVCLETDNMIELLSRSDMIVHNEFVLLEAVIRWLTENSRMSELAVNIDRILDHIRFKNIFPTYLASFEESIKSITVPELRTSYVQDVFVKHLIQGYRYHALGYTNYGISTRSSATDHTTMTNWDRNYTDVRPHMVYVQISQLDSPIAGTVTSRLRRAVIRHATLNRRALTICEVELEIRPVTEITPSPVTMARAGMYEVILVLRYKGTVTLTGIVVSLAARRRGASCCYNNHVITVERTFQFDTFRKEYAIDPVIILLKGPTCDGNYPGMSFDVFLRPLVTSNLNNMMSPPMNPPSV